MKRLAIFLITIFTMFSCEDFYKDNGCIEMYEGNTSGNTQSNSQNSSQDNYQNSYTVYFYAESVQWDNVYVYSFGNTGGSNDKLMINDWDGWYYATVEYPNVIFHSVPIDEGWGEQTKDLSVDDSYYYFTPIQAYSDKIGCDKNSYKYNYTLPRYDVYFYNGELNCDFLEIGYGNLGRGIKTMTYDGDNWYYAETIYPEVFFVGNGDALIPKSGLVDCKNYTYFVPDVDTLAVSQHSSKPDL